MLTLLKFDLSYITIYKLQMHFLIDSYFTKLSAYYSYDLFLNNCIVYGYIRKGYHIQNKT